MNSRPSAGFTLLEVLLATMLLVGTVGLLFGAFSTAGQWFQGGGLREATGVNLARERLEELYREVRRDTWDTGALNTTGGGWISDGVLTLDGVPYTRSYKVDPVPGADHRKVQVKVQWP